MPEPPVLDDSSALFSAATALVRTSPPAAFEAGAQCSFTGEVHPRWTIAGKPNGGYLLALLGRAATLASTHRDVIAASAHYLRPPQLGPVAVTTELLRAGRTASQLRTRLVQDGGTCVEGLITMADLDPAAEPYWAAGAPDPGVSDRETLTPLPAVNPMGTRVEIMGVVDLRVDTETFGWAQHRPTGRGELRGWLALPGDEAPDPLSLLYAVDGFPPATFDIEMTGWVPTLELTAYVRALPAPGPLRVLQRAHLIDGGRVDESCWVWDARGRVVARATQLAAIRLG